MSSTQVKCVNDVDCFNEGTKILCVAESGAKVYIPVEQLKPGMLVETYLSGPKPIQIIGNSIRSNESVNLTSCMYRMRRRGEMIDDLILSGGHSILVDKRDITHEQRDIQFKKYKVNFAIEDKRGLLVCISDDFVKISDNKQYTRYNFALVGATPDDRFGVYANGVLCETPSVNQAKKIGFDNFQTR